MTQVPGHTLSRVIGRGASSVVWAGHDAMGEVVAVKVPHPGSDATHRLQSATERHVLTALRHEHLVTLRDIVPLPDGRVATVFDLVDGASLRSMVDARGHLRPGETVTVLTPICDAAALLHRSGAIHGDISPGNVLVTADGRPRLADLGAARIAGSGAAVVGTTGFVAPEVVAGEVPSEASDVYALGALAWFCLTGNGAPDTPIRLSPETIASHVGPELADVVGACIDPEPARRPSSDRLAQLVFAATTAEPIEVVVGADETSALTHRIRAAAASSLQSPPAARSGRGRWGAGVMSLRSAVRSLAGAGAVVLMLLAALTGWLTWGGGSAEPVGAVSGPRLTPVVPTSSVSAPLTSAGASTGSVRPSGMASGPVPGRAASAQAVATRAGGDVTNDPEAARTRAQSLMTALADRRAALLVRRDSLGLGEVHVRDSPSWRADAALLDTLTRGGQRYDGLGVAAVEAEPLSASADRAVLRARVDLTAYEVVDERGGRTARPAVTGQVLDFALVRTAAGWRVESITVPAST